MASWVNLTDTQLDPDAPLTSNLAYAWRDNPIAIAEGASGAPRVATRVRGDSVHASASTTGSATISGMGGHDGIVVNGLYGSVSTVTVDSISVSLSDNGTTFSATTDIVGASTSTGQGAFTVFVDFGTGAYKVSRYHTGGLASYATGTLATPAGAVTHVRFTITSTGVGSSLSVIGTTNGGESAS